MAKSTEKDKVETSSIENKDTKSVLKENEELKKELDEMKEQIKMLLSMNKDSNVEQPKKKKTRKMIPFINLTMGKLVLRGTSDWEIVGQFSTRKFSENEARVIVNNMWDCIKRGFVYIADSAFVEEQELSDIYETLLSDKELKELLTKEPNIVIDAYNNACKSQKDIIISMVEDGRLNGQDIDYNILVELGKIANKDFIGIEPMEE